MLAPDILDHHHDTYAAPRRYCVHFLVLRDLFSIFMINWKTLFRESIPCSLGPWIGAILVRPAEAPTAVKAQLRPVGV
jgi:hypothetical protein